jgi:glycosidase
LFTYPGAPSIYYGDEIGLDGQNDPDCRKSFLWDETTWDQELLSCAKEMIALRKRHPALRRGDFTRLWSAEGMYAFSRSLDGKILVVALNTSESPRQAEVAFESKENTLTLFGEASLISAEAGRLKFTVPARSGVVLG